MSPGPEGSDDAARPAPLTRRYRRYLRVEGIHAGVSIGNGMPPDRLALRRYDEFGVTWPIPERDSAARWLYAVGKADSGVAVRL